MEGEQVLPHVTIDQFEGPFDLLIELARSHKIDLSRVSLTELTDSFLAYLKTTPLPTAVQADFLVVASTLLLLKVYHLLPELTRQEEEEIAELTDRLRVYELYRRYARMVHARWGQALLLPGPTRLTIDAPVPFPSVRVEDLAEQWRALCAHVQPPRSPQRHLRKHFRSLQECIELLTTRIKKYQRLILQKELHGEPAQVAAVTFLAVLEMARTQRVRLRQEAPFAALHIDVQP